MMTLVEPPQSGFRFLHDDTGWNTDGGRPGWNVPQDNSIGPDYGVIANPDGAKQLGASTDIDVVPNCWRTAAITADGHLLENKAVGTDHGLWMNDDTVGVGKLETAADPGSQRDLALRQERKDGVVEQPVQSEKPTHDTFSGNSTVITPNRAQQASTIVSTVRHGFPRPIRDTIDFYQIYVDVLQHTAHNTSTQTPHGYTQYTLKTSRPMRKVCYFYPAMRLEHNIYAYKQNFFNRQVNK